MLLSLCESLVVYWWATPVPLVCHMCSLNQPTLVQLVHLVSLVFLQHAACAVINFVVVGLRHIVMR